MDWSWIKPPLVRKALVGLARIMPVFWRGSTKLKRVSVVRHAAEPVPLGTDPDFPIAISWPVDQPWPPLSFIDLGAATS